jgi:hypothetical protein
MSQQQLVPANNLSLTSAPTLPTITTGDMYWNTSTSTLMVYNGSSWVSAVTASGGAGAAFSEFMLMGG